MVSLHQRCFWEVSCRWTHPKWTEYLVGSNFWGKITICHLGCRSLLVWIPSPQRPCHWASCPLRRMEFQNFLFFLCLILVRTLMISIAILRFVILLFYLLLIINVFLVMNWLVPIFPPNASGISLHSLELCLTFQIWSMLYSSSYESFSVPLLLLMSWRQYCHSSRSYEHCTSPHVDFSILIVHDMLCDSFQECILLFSIHCS